MVASYYVSLLAPERPAADPLAAELLIREARRRQRRRRLAVSGLVVAVLGGVAIVARPGAASPRHGPMLSRPRQVPSVGSGYGLILHIDWTTIQPDEGWTYEQEVYEETSPPYLTRTIVVKSVDGTPPGTEGLTGFETGEQTYDPTNNTIYDPPTPPPPPGALTQAQAAKMFPPYMSQFVAHLRAQLASGEAHVDGPATVDGRAAIKVTIAGSNAAPNSVATATATGDVISNGNEIAYVTADGSDTPIETILQGPPIGAPSSTMRQPMTTQVVNVYHRFEYLAAAGNMGLLSLTAQHPNARIDTNLRDSRAAGNRLFRNG